MTVWEKFCWFSPACLSNAFTHLGLVCFEFAQFQVCMYKTVLPIFCAFLIVRKRTSFRGVFKYPFCQMFLQLSLLTGDLNGCCEIKLSFLNCKTACRSIAYIFYFPADFSLFGMENSLKVLRGFSDEHSAQLKATHSFVMAFVGDAAFCNTIRKMNNSCCTKRVFGMSQSKFLDFFLEKTLFFSFYKISTGSWLTNIRPAVYYHSYNYWLRASWWH